MSLRLPQVSGRQLVRLLETLGYRVIRQRGSHIRLRNSDAQGEHNITIPDHRTLAIGTLNDILNQVSLRNSVLKQDLINQLREL